MSAPNILLITSDQQHYSMLGKVNDILSTPNLDRLADEGMLFDRAYCPNPTCSPSRASILTGMYPSEHGCWSLGTKMPESTPTLSHYLGDNGYETALIGKAHFQPFKTTPEYLSLESPDYMYDIDFWRNFKDKFYGFEHIELVRSHTAEKWIGQHYVAWLEDNGCMDWRKYFFRPRGTMRNKSFGSWKMPEKYHYNTWIAERANAMIEQSVQQDKPFFVWASFPDPHYPQLVPAPWDKMYKPKDMQLPEFSMDEHKNNPPYFREVFKLVPRLAQYRESGQGIHGLQKQFYNKKRQQKKLAYAYGMVSFMDKYIGKILDKVKQLGIEENTIIVFTTDHGDLYGQHGFIHKCVYHYEDLLRVPMIVKYKGHVPEGVRSDSLQSLIDLAPTFTKLCGLQTPGVMTGEDQSDVWLGKKDSVRDYAICENRHEPHLMHMVSFVEKDFKITVHEGRDYGELYDLNRDGGEHDNLWGNPSAKQLKADMLAKFCAAEMAKDKVVEAITDLLGYTFYMNSQSKIGTICNAEGKNIWNDAAFIDEKIAVLLAAISQRIGARPMWMPRVSAA